MMVLYKFFFIIVVTCLSLSYTINAWSIVTEQQWQELMAKVEHSQIQSEAVDSLGTLDFIQAIRTGVLNEDNLYAILNSEDSLKYILNSKVLAILIQRLPAKIAILVFNVARVRVLNNEAVNQAIKDTIVRDLRFLTEQGEVETLINQLAPVPEVQNAVRAAVGEAQERRQAALREQAEPQMLLVEQRHMGEVQQIAAMAAMTECQYKQGDDAIVDEPKQTQRVKDSELGANGAPPSFMNSITNSLGTAGGWLWRHGGSFGATIFRGRSVQAATASSSKQVESVQDGAQDRTEHGEAAHVQAGDEVEGAVVAPATVNMLQAHLQGEFHEVAMAALPPSTQEAIETNHHNATELPPVHGVEQLRHGTATLRIGFNNILSGIGSAMNNFNPDAQAK